MAISYSQDDLLLALERRALALEVVRPKGLVDLFPPNSDPQRMFLETEADIAIIGGSAGGGKTIAEFLDATRHIDNPGYSAVVFRRTMKMVKDEGGLWDKSTELFPLIGGKPNHTNSYWTFPSGCSLQFAGLETDASKLDYQGSQICKIVFDELTHFLESQFFYLLSRNRSTCGIRPTVRGSTNPEPGWVKRLLAPWVDRTFPDPARSGEIRWFVRDHNQIVWVARPPDRGVCDKGPDGKKCLKDGCETCFPPEKSITFIRASVYDNRDLLEANPEYIGNLKALEDVDRRRLLDGDWDARPANLVLDAFDESANVVSWRDTTGWKKYVGADFGLINTAEVVVAEEPTTKDLYIIAEDWPGHSRNFVEIARAIKDMAGGTPVDGAGGNRTGEQGWRQAMRKEGIPMAEPVLEHTDPALQYKNMNDLFGTRRLFVFETCRVFISMALGFQRLKDPKDGEPTDKFDDARYHLLAAGRYILVKLRPPTPRMTSIGAERVAAANMPASLKYVPR